MPLSIIKDPVTGKSYSRDESVAGSAYAPYIAPGVMPPTATPATAYKGIDLGAYDNSTDVALDQALARTAANMAVPKEKDIYRTKLRQYQGEIDAVNKIYAQKLAETRQQGLGNLGSGRAIQARSGLLGSDFAASQNAEITQSNNKAEQLVRDEQALKLASIMGTARQDAAEELAAKRAAQASSTKDYLDFLAAKATRKASNAQKVAQALIDQDIDTTQVDPMELDKIAKTYGISKTDIVSSYKDLKQKREDAERERLLSEAKEDLRFNPETGEYERTAPEYETVPDGSTLVDPLTGEVIYDNPEDYDPDSGTTSSGSPKLGATQLKQKDALEAVRLQLANYRNLIATSVGDSGVNLIGKDAARLRTAKASLEFAIAVAVGTGALQAPDRAVVEEIIPNPTSLRGAVGTSIRGKKEGALASLDEADKIFQASLSTIGASAGEDIEPHTDIIIAPDGTEVQIID